MPAKVTKLLLVMLFEAAVISLCISEVYGQEKEVVVIGGGIAGLSAARQLTNQGRGKWSVRVFEARKERYGGRVWTDRLKNPKARGLEVDLGAFALNTWDGMSNPLVNLTRDLGLEMAKLSSPQFIVPWRHQTYSGDELRHAFIAASSILQAAVNHSRVEGKDVSVRAAVDRELVERGLDSQDPTSLLLHSLKSYQLPDYSSHLYQPHAIDFGYDHVLLDGMGELLDRLASGTEDERPLKISLHTEVRQVKVDRIKDKVILRLRDGSQVQVDEVVVAVPVSVITQQHLLFEPVLPKHYITALSNIGMTASNKVIIEFDVAFWSGNHGVFLRAEEEEENRGCLQTWINLHQVLGLPVLMGMMSGHHATHMETLSDSELRELVLKKLKSTFGEDSVSDTNIIRISRSSWMSDPLTGGGSSYPSVGDSGEFWDTLSEPWCPHVYFAGEHTLFRQHGTLHGAYLSGIRAADQILSNYCPIKARREEAERRKEEERRKAQEKEINKMDRQETDDERETGAETEEGVRDEL